MGQKCFEIGVGSTHFKTQEAFLKSPCPLSSVHCLQKKSPNHLICNNSTKTLILAPTKSAWCGMMNTSDSRSCHNLSPISKDEEVDSTDIVIGEDDEDISSRLHVPNIICSNKFENMIYIGLVFESDKEAYEAYLLYALKVGFRVRKNKQYLRDDGTVRSRYFVCFREGERRKDRRYQYVRKESKAREETRTGCKARMAVKNLHNQWVVSEIIHQHNHPLISPDNAEDIVADDKDRIIRELSEELHQEKRLRTACQKRINQILKDVEEYSQNLSSKIEVVVGNVSTLDSEGLHCSDNNDN